MVGSTTFYLVPSLLNLGSLDNEDVLANSIAGQVNAGEITFNQVVAGNYVLAALSNDVFIALTAAFDVERDFDFSSSVTLPASLVLAGNNWNITETTLIWLGWRYR